MTIASRLILLLTVPLVALAGLGVFTRLQLAEIEARSRFVAESRIAALAALGNLSRSFSELRVNLLSHLLATTDTERARARALFDEDKRDVTRLLQDGRIWLDSEPGVGTTFSFTVWLGIGTGIGSAKIIPERLARLRVLVVDDNAAAREILQEPLIAVVSRVDVVASGKDAIAAIRQHDATAPYDIVFMDWRMPGMDGLQASRHIKSDERLSHQPAIVMVTAFGREEVREEAERLQLDGFLVKPVTKSMIVDTLVNVFSHGEHETSQAAETEQAAAAGRPGRDSAPSHDELAEQNPRGMFVTMQCLVFDLEHRRVSCASAGHHQLAVLSPGRPPRLGCPSTGRPAGLMPFNPIERETLPIEPGDMFVLFSDGVSEAISPEHDFYGEERLLATLATPSSPTPADTVARLLADVRLFANGAKQSDDITILAAQYVPLHG